MNREYSDEEIVEIVKAFKIYIKKIVKHSAIDFIRISKKNKYKEILYSDLVDEKVSLSVTEREKQNLSLILKDYTNCEIKRIMKITDNNIYNIKLRIRKKIEGKRYGK